MKNLIKFFSIVIMAMFMFTSCEKDGTNDDLKEVSFGIENVTDIQASTLKSATSTIDIECSDAKPLKAKLVIDGVEYEPGVFEVNGELYTQAIKLPSGRYTVSSFELLDDDGTTIMATPATESVYADYVTETVPFSLEVSVFDKTERSVEVLCYNIAEYENFGFSWLNIGQVSVHELLFYGDVCIDPVLYEGSVYGDLTNYPFDVPALFEIRTFVDGEPLKVFSNVGQNLGPLAVEYYTHSNKVLTFNFELWVYLYDEQQEEVVLTLVDVLTFTSDDPLTATDVSNVIDFVIGDCVYTPSQLTYTKSTNGWVEQNTDTGGETAWSGNIEGLGNAWWYYLDAEIATGGVPIYAGQNLIDGASVTLEYQPWNGSGDWYNMVIDLGDNMILQDGNETVKIQKYNYNDIPTSRPSAGDFTTYKGNELIITNITGTLSGVFFAVHLDVEVNA